MGHSQPTLSIVTPVYNLVSAGRSDVFRQCAESVREQAARVPLEHLVVDSCSADGTAELLAPYAKYDYCRIIEKRDRSVYEGMNNGLREAKGKYVLFLNSDDCLVPGEALKMAVADLESSGADYAYGAVNVVDTKGAPVEVWDGDLSKLPFAKHYCHQSMIVRRNVLEGYGGFNLRYRISADSDLMLHLYRDRKRGVKNRLPIANYREGGMSGSRWKTALEDHATAFYGYFGRDVGMSLDDCRALWCYRGIGTLSYEMCEHILALLPERSWREEWLTRMRAGYEGKMKAIRRSGLLYRIGAKLKHGGVVELIRACIRRFGKIEV